MSEAPCSCCVVVRRTWKTANTKRVQEKGTNSLFLRAAAARERWQRYIKKGTRPLRSQGERRARGARRLAESGGAEGIGEEARGARVERRRWRSNETCECRLVGTNGRMICAQRGGKSGAMGGLSGERRLSGCVSHRREQWSPLAHPCSASRFAAQRNAIPQSNTHGTAARTAVRLEFGTHRSEESEPQRTVGQERANKRCRLSNFVVELSRNRKYTRAKHVRFMRIAFSMDYDDNTNCGNKVQNLFDKSNEIVDTHIFI